MTEDPSDSASSPDPSFGDSNSAPDANDGAGGSTEASDSVQNGQSPTDTTDGATHDGSTPDSELGKAMAEEGHTLSQAPRSSQSSNPSGAKTANRTEDRAEPEPDPDRLPDRLIPPLSPKATEADIKKQQYQRAFLQALQLEYPLATEQQPGYLLSEAMQKSLKDMLADSGLETAEAEAIEAEATQAYQRAKAQYHEGLKAYRQRLDEATAADQPIDSLVDDLSAIQRHWNLQSEDVIQIEHAVFSQHPLPHAAPPPVPEHRPLVAPPRPAVVPAVAPPPAIESSRPSAPAAPAFSAFDPLNPIFLKLETALKGKAWKIADQTTLTLLLTETRRTAIGWLDEQAINSLSCHTLQRIDQLWKKHSNSQFSFSIQLTKYTNLLPLQAHHHVAEDKAARALQFLKLSTSGGSEQGVGWWLPGLECVRFYNQLTFETQDENGNAYDKNGNKVPDGHFPALWYWGTSWQRSLQLGGLGMGAGRGGCRPDAVFLDAFMQKLDQCLNQPISNPFSPAVGAAMAAPVSPDFTPEPNLELPPEFSEPETLPPEASPPEAADEAFADADAEE